MSVALLQSVGAWIDTLTLETTYKKKYFRYGEADLANPIILIRKSGSTLSDKDLSVSLIDVMVIDGIAGIVELKNDIDAIETLARSTTYPVGAIKCRVAASSTDPIPMENDKFYCLLRLEVTL